MPAVSVLTTVRNAKEYIGASIQSILDQTMVDFELIIIDDASTDGTWDIISQYATKDSRIKIFHNQTPRGIPANRNQLLKYASTEFIAWQDGDDISRPNRLQLQLEKMKSDPDIGICGGWLDFFSDDGNHHGIRKYDTDDKILRKKIFKFSPVAQPAAMIRRSIFGDVGGYDESLAVAEDLDMAFRIGEKFKFANVSEVVLQYRQQHHSATFVNLKKLEKNTLAIRRSYRHSPAYNFTLSDAIYNFLQGFTLYFIGAKTRVALFNLIRNS